MLIIIIIVILQMFHIYERFILDNLDDMSNHQYVILYLYHFYLLCTMYKHILC